MRLISGARKHTKSGLESVPRRKSHLQRELEEIENILKIAEIVNGTPYTKADVWEIYNLEQTQFLSEKTEPAP